MKLTLILLGIILAMVLFKPKWSSAMLPSIGMKWPKFKLKIAPQFEAQLWWLFKWTVRIGFFVLLTVLAINFVPTAWAKIFPPKLEVTHGTDKQGNHWKNTQILITTEWQTLYQLLKIQQGQDLPADGIEAHLWPNDHTILVWCDGMKKALPMNPVKAGWIQYPYVTYYLPGLKFKLADENSVTKDTATFSIAE